MIQKMDKQFLFFLIQNIFIGICGLIDTAFGNHIDLDSICVLSAYTVITWTTYCIYSIGSYAYRVVLDKAKSCFLIQVAASVVLGILLVLLSDRIPHIYSLTPEQYQLFSDCLRVHAISLPVLGIREFLGNYAEYLCKNRQAIRGNIILYGLMIITDAVVFYLHGNLVHLLVCTGICSLAYSVYMIFSTGFLREPFHPDWPDIVQLLKYGRDTCIDRITGKVATIVFNIYASRLGTHLYSIHAVCYALGVFTENGTNALFTYQVVSLAGQTNDDKFSACRKIARKYALFLLLLSYLICYVLLLFLHGNVDIKDCLFYTGVYCTEIIALLLYEPMKAYLTSMKETKYLRYGGIFGIFVRIPIALIGYYMGLGLFPFAIASTMDFAARGIYFYCCGRKIRRHLWKEGLERNETRRDIKTGNCPV